MSFHVLSVVMSLMIGLGESRLSFFAMGDWGGSPHSPYSTPEERKTASTMGQVANQFTISFGTGIGDNFYDDGVENEHDKRFRETFEDVFTAKDLYFPWYMVAGNHDHHRNVSGQIAYSHLSKRWNFPSEYYTKIFSLPSSSKKLQLVWIDTVILSGQTTDLKWCQANPDLECLLQPKGPEDPDIADAQWNWIEHTLASSTADYLIVLGHYPVWSIAEHGPTSDLVNKLRPMLKKYRVTAYFCGHDHTMEYLQEKGSNIGYVVTGAAHYCDTSTAHKHSVPSGSLKYHGCDDGGFVRVDVDDTILNVFYYLSKSNKPVFEVGFKPRK